MDGLETASAAFLLPSSPTPVAFPSRLLTSRCCDDHLNPPPSTAAGDAVATATATRTPARSDFPTLQEAVERCLPGVRFGAVTLAECRARWSEYADRLEALVRERLQALQDEITIEQALLFCLRHIEAGELTPEGCPQHFPWLAEDLKPLLREALGGTNDATTKDPSADGGTDTTADAATATPTATPSDSLDSSTIR